MKDIFKEDDELSKNSDKSTDKEDDNFEDTKTSRIWFSLYLPATNSSIVSTPSPSSSKTENRFWALSAALITVC